MTGASPRDGVAREGSIGSGMLMRNPRVSGREAAFQGAEGVIRYPPLPSCAQSRIGTDRVWSIMRIRARTRPLRPVKCTAVG